MTEDKLFCELSWDKHKLTTEEREKRLQALREHYKMTDEEMVTRFKNGIGSWGSGITEWLVLIGRGDLVL